MSESINGNQMKLDTLREYNEKKSIVQEPNPLTSNPQLYFFSEII